jgi:hypothetical protein
MQIAAQALDLMVRQRGLPAVGHRFLDFPYAPVEVAIGIPPDFGGAFAFRPVAHQAFG